MLSQSELLEILWEKFTKLRNDQSRCKSYQRAGYEELIAKLHNLMDGVRSGDEYLIGTASSVVEKELRLGLRARILTVRDAQMESRECLDLSQEIARLEEMMEGVEREDRAMVAEAIKVVYAGY